MRDFVEEYDAVSEAYLNRKRQGRRKHLGASEVGGKCYREGWYGFRWLGQEKFDGRMLRLFERGHEEEFNFVLYLREMGVTVYDYTRRLLYHENSDCYVLMPWDDFPEMFGHGECVDVSEDRVHIARATARGEGPRQWRFSRNPGDELEPRLDPDSGFPLDDDGTGHFGGGCDAILEPDALVPYFPQIAGLGRGGGEFKTHNDKSFKELVQKGLKRSKPVHFIQMQEYMHFFGLKWCLYLAVNKNDDRIHPVVVMYEEATARQYAERGMEIITLRTAPKRLSEDSSWWECRFCAHHGMCHFNEPTEDKNCRSCAFSEPAPGGQWLCNYYRQQIPDNYIAQGCAEWVQVR